MTPAERKMLALLARVVRELLGKKLYPDDLSALNEMLRDHDERESSKRYGWAPRSGSNKIVVRR